MVLTRPVRVLALVLAILCVIDAQVPVRAQVSPPAISEDAASALAQAERARCLTRDRQRSALADGKAVPLAQALRNLRRRIPGELVKARLCQDGDRLIYMLTMLPRDGKVRRAVVDAANGNLVSER
jgi:uncharacterized membrane protein YkoI